MSRAYILLARADGQLDRCVEFRNAHGFGAFVFTSLVEKYRAQISRVKLTEQQAREFFGPFGDWCRLWNWVRDDQQPKLPAFELNTLVANYDGAYVRGAEHIGVLADSFERFAKEHAKGDRIQHLTKMADALRASLQLDTEYVCFYPMSVSADHWQVMDDPETGESHAFRFGDPEDEKKVEHTRYHVAPVNGPDVALDDLLGGP